MKTLTVKELAQELQGVLVNLASVDGYGVRVDMTRARVDYDADFNEITFTSENHNHEGVASISYHANDCIETITQNEDGSYTIEFMYMSDVEIRKAVE